MVLDAAGDDAEKFDALKKLPVTLEQTGPGRWYNGTGSLPPFRRSSPRRHACDQVNRVRESDDARIAWDRTMDLHSEFWQGHGDRYYALRQALVDGLLSATDYALEVQLKANEIVKKSP